MHMSSHRPHAPGRRATLLAAAGMAALPHSLRAQGSATRFPDRSIRLIVPFPPGGATDVHMRVLCDIASRKLGQPVIVENKAGAAGTLGALTLAKQGMPDGYLLSQMPQTVSRYTLMSRRPQYDPIADFTYIIHLTGYLFGVVVRADAPWGSSEEFLAYAKANPGRATYGSSGVGGTLHVVMERIAGLKGLEWTHVPFGGSAPNLQSVLAGQTDAMADGATWAPLVEEGRLRCLCTWGPTRARRFPEVPTLRDLGIDIVANSAYGIGGPRGMDPGVVRTLHDAFKEALFDPAHVAALDRFNQDVLYQDSADYTAYVREELEVERAVIARLGLRID